MRQDDRDNLELDRLLIDNQEPKPVNFWLKRANSNGRHSGIRS
jgi:hypothetical protein